MTVLQQGRAGHLLATVAGALITLSLAPFNLWVLGIISIALLAWLLQPLSPLAAAIRGWWYGVGLFGAGTSWVYVSIHLYGNAPAPLAGLLTLIFCLGLGLFTALTFWFYARWIRPDNASGSLAAGLAFAGIWTLGDWLRSWLLTGFPWLYPGYGHLETPLAGWAPVTGIYGLGFILALSGYTLWQVVQSRQWRQPLLLATVLLWLGGSALSSVDWVRPSADRPLRVAMVQANIPQHEKWLPANYWPTLNLYNRMSQPLWEQHDLVIWPEAAIPNYYHNARHFIERIAAVASSSGSSFITGIPVRDEQDPDRYYNGIMAFGEGSGRYYKQRLVPFGEYVPLEQWLRGLIAFFDLPMSAFSAGDPNQQGLIAGQYRLAPFICYEVVYPDLVADWMPDADFLITISNDAWFGRSIGPLQHLEMARMRALEHGRYMLRATGNGVSAIIDHRGQITARSEQFERQILSGQAQAMTGSTPYSHSGNSPILVLALLCCLLPAIRRRSLAAG